MKSTGHWSRRLPSARPDGREPESAHDNAPAAGPRRAGTWQARPGGVKLGKIGLDRTDVVAQIRRKRSLMRGLARIVLTLHARFINVRGFDQVESFPGGQAALDRDEV
jgi:hypothetical protein